MRHPVPAFLILAACAAPHSAITGVQTVPDAPSAILKSAAVHGAREEIELSSDHTGMRNGIYLDTLVGPTPPEALYRSSHPRAWLDAMVSTHQVDGLFGVPLRNGRPLQDGFAIEVGEPSPAGHDTLQIAYDWCVRRFSVKRATPGPASVWRDLFVRSDTGWARVAHLRTVAAAACTP